jgi:hypothetical protein
MVNVLMLSVVMLSVVGRLNCSIDYDRKKFYDTDTHWRYLGFEIRGLYYKNLLQPYFINFHNKLECLSLASVSNLVQYLRARLEPTRVKYHSGAPI